MFQYKSFFLSVILGVSVWGFLASNETIVENNRVDNVLFISLGSICTPASELRKYNLRQAAYPFDWMLSIDGMKFIDILKDDFEYFLDERFLKPYFSNGILMHDYYHLEFSHEENSFQSPVFKPMRQLQEKYTRRIQRFRDLKQYQGRVCFIRHSWSLSMHENYRFRNQDNLSINKEYSYLLYDTLKNYFPALDFILIIVNADLNQQGMMKKDLTDKIKIYSGSIIYSEMFEEIEKDYSYK
ncbi:MAG: hypothetical protein JW769_02930 [Parachlamydiales bacterium]|nr:hypothetical protein [Parachlamydiales bacterium]